MCDEHGRPFGLVRSDLSVRIRVRWLGSDLGDSVLAREQSVEVDVIGEAHTGSDFGLGVSRELGWSKQLPCGLPSPAPAKYTRL